MKTLMTSALVAVTLTGPAAAFGAFPFQIFDMQFPSDIAPKGDATERNRAEK